MRVWLSTFLELVGMALLILGGFTVSTGAGLIAIGVVAAVFGFLLEPV